MPFKTFKAVHDVVFSRGAIAALVEMVCEKRDMNGYAVFVIDHFFKNGLLDSHIPFIEDDVRFFLDTTDEPKTSMIDDYVETIRREKGDRQPCAVVGIGGGSAMDAAKALAIMLTNPGKTHEYQGWDKVIHPGVYKIGVPTISGTGAEVSRTTVLSGPEKKQGINSEHSLFDAIILDPDLPKTVPFEQRFFTGMDCYIHGVESITGSFLNEFSEAFASKSLDLCRQVFLKDADDADLMVASYLGGCAIVYSEVGVCHALSYGISHTFGIHHGLSNCIVFDHLDAYYPKALPEFRKMLDKNNISLPRDIASDIDDATMERMIDITLLMEKPLHNALGPKWREILTRAKIRELYLKILRM